MEYYFINIQKEGVNRIYNDVHNCGKDKEEAFSEHIEEQGFPPIFLKCLKIAALDRLYDVILPLSLFNLLKCNSFVVQDH